MTGTFATLVRHFIAAGLAPEVLTEIGADYLRRVIFGVLAILLVLGSFLPRVFFHKYTELGGVVGSDAYLRALQADTLFMLAVPMFLIGLATVIAGPLLFPDETDYRVLTPLPISRAMLFGAKLVAVVAIVAAAIVAVNAVATFWFPIAVTSRKAQHPLLARVIAHGVAATAGSVFMCVAVMAVQGLTIVAVPSSWQRRISIFVQGAMSVGLVLSVPTISRMPGLDVTSATITTPPLEWLPPAWFMGIEWWWLNGSNAGGYIEAARTGIFATAVASAIVFVSYSVLYRSAERLAGMSGADRRTVRSPNAVARWLAARFAPRTLAIVEFVRAGVLRSRLHQFVFLFAAGGGIAVMIAQIASALEGATPFASRPAALVEAVIGAPLVVALAFVLGLRTAYKWPLDRGAGWIFLVTEDADTRPQLLDGATWWLFAGGWGSAMLTALVVQPSVLGAAVWPAAFLTTLTVLALIEFMMLEWRRVPFTCTYLPGTRVLAYHIGVLFAQYFVVVVIGMGLIRFGVGSPLQTLTIAGFLIAAWAALRRERVRVWGRLPLEFEDDDPSEVKVLRLQ